MLELKNIIVKRGEHLILDNITLNIDENKLIVITGPNGSGKSTLMKSIMGIEEITSGKILFNGNDITNLKVNERANQGIGFAFQQPVRFKGIKVLDLLKYANPTASATIIRDTLHDVGICAKDYLNREVGDELSGGELKRIEIASVLLRDSQLIIFDEPEAGIDIWSFDRLISAFKNLKDNKHATVIIVSHQEKILQIADEIILIENGKISQFDKAEKILPILKNSVQKSCKYKKEEL